MDVCASKVIGGLNVIDQEEALHVLMTKWIFKALGPSDLNLQIFLRFQFFRLKPNKRGKWQHSLQ